MDSIEGVVVYEETKNFSANNNTVPPPISDLEMDRLTDSNSSEKSPAPAHEDTVDNGDSGDIPLNFPVRGKILARLQGRGFEYFMTKPKIVIGRNSSKGDVDINMGHSNFISRHHLEVEHDGTDFYLRCGGKNGVFVDDIFLRIGTRFRLLRSCALRFPSTQIVIAFDAAECFIDKYSLKANQHASKSSGEQTLTITNDHSPNPAMRSLNIDIPSVTTKPVFFSPCPSPTGTISAVNSCPASPNSGSKHVPVFARRASARPYSSAYSLTDKSPIPAAKDTRIPVSGDDEAKPPYSYAQLIVQAISSVPEKQMTLSGIYAYISRNYSYYRANDKGWQNSIRHNLSLNRYFVKIARSQEEPGKGSFWTIDPVSEPKLVSQAFRRRNKRGVPYFRGTPSDLTTQSCPASPTRSLSSTNQPLLSPTSEITVPAPVENISVTSTSYSVVPNSTESSTTVIAAAHHRSSSHIIDVSQVRGFQSAPGSPEGFKLLSPSSLIATTKVLPKPSFSSVGGGGITKPAGITLIQPISSLSALQVAGKPGHVLALSTAAAAPQALQVTVSTGSLLTTGSQPIVLTSSVLQAGNSTINKLSNQPTVVQAVPLPQPAQLLQSLKRDAEEELPEEQKTPSKVQKTS